MPIVGPEKLVELQSKPDVIRNICILAHVDHGKTSLSDALIATNGIISPKLAGKIRYLDSRQDEQLRGITMESSAISLYFSLSRRQDAATEPETKEYLINLIDSPGHIDFSSEVSTASRLCDGALVLVDAVEGVCSQTVTVLRQVWVEKLKPILIINKIDRLILELKMTPQEAQLHLSQLLERVNAVIGSFFQGERMEDDLQWRVRLDEKIKSRTEKARQTSEIPDEADEDINAYEEKDDEDLYVAPEKNNVIFCSAVDGWAFTTRQFATIYEKKLGIKRSLLEKVLWGEYYLDMKTKRVLAHKHLKGRSLKPMFAQLVLEPIWAIYNATMLAEGGKADPMMVQKITSSLSLALAPHILRAKDTRVIMNAIFAAWLPVSTAVLVSVIEYLPSPPISQESRLPHILSESPGALSLDPKILDVATTFNNSPEAPTLAFVSKMVSFPLSELSQRKKSPNSAMTGEEARDLARKKRAEIERSHALLGGRDSISTQPLSEVLDVTDLKDAINIKEDGNPECLIGFARVFSGVLTVGDILYVISPKYNPSHKIHHPEPRQVKITSLYLMMGRSLESIDCAPAGVVCGIGGLDGFVLKSSTLCSQVSGAPNLAGISMGSQPIVRVALEPVDPSDLDKLVHGMKLLEQSDPCARYEVLDSGEHVILTAGELHLERCLKDLRERFAKCDIQAGEPIVPYRETIVSSPDMAPPKNKDLPRGTVLFDASIGKASIRLRVRPLPEVAVKFIEKNSASVRAIHDERNLNDESSETDKGVDSVLLPDDPADTRATDTATFLKSLQNLLQAEKKHESAWANISEKIISYGPRRIGANLLVDATPGSVLLATTDPSTTNIIDKISYAFQMATAKGPMCHEPIQGIAVFLESIQFAGHSNVDTVPDSHDILSPSPLPPPPLSSPSDPGLQSSTARQTSELLKAATKAIHTGFLDWSPRLMLAYYDCTVQSSVHVLGRTYATLAKLHAIIVSESLKEGTPFYTIVTLLPVATSFHVAGELLKSTSGSAQAQASGDSTTGPSQQLMTFHGFEILDEDPYWIPLTEDELEEFGRLGDRDRWSKVLLDGVRRRKGLLVQGDLVVKEGEKQKTLKR